MGIFAIIGHASAFAQHYLFIGIKFDNTQTSYFCNNISNIFLISQIHDKCPNK